MTSPSGAARIEVSLSCPAWRRALPDAAARCERAALAALAEAAPSLEGEIAIVLGDDPLLRRLNRKWRGRDCATNVLSFPGQDFAAGMPRRPAPTAPLPLGDVVLAIETIDAEAQAQGKTIADHLSHLVVHGVLHLVGFDHLEAAEAEAMEGMERRILAGLGIADPYAEDAAAGCASDG
ncbi:MAG: rRNA maturation RNase YbeY [Alphaproteobacteria bacterium]|nr:rRNA maturation RNase YbeY [Alphaproteobacteria bacterium]